MMMMMMMICLLLFLLFLIISVTFLGLISHYSYFSSLVMMSTQNDTVVTTWTSSHMGARGEARPGKVFLRGAIAESRLPSGEWQVARGDI